MTRKSLSMDATRGGHVAWSMLIGILMVPLGRAAALDVGTVVATEGTVEIARGPSTAPAALNASITVGDELRTGSPGKTELGFFDRDVATAVVGEESAAIVSSLAIGDNSLAVVDKYEFDPRGPQARFLLMRGRASALVRKTSRGCEIKTPTAVALATGTAFVVSYDPSTEMTEVVGVSGQLRVTGLAGREVWVNAREITAVAKGRPPTPPRPLTEEQFRQHMEGLEFIGGGRPESLTVGSALREGTLVPQPDRFISAGAPFSNTNLACPIMASAPTCTTQEPISGLGSLDVQF